MFKELKAKVYAIPEHYLDFLLIGVIIALTLVVIYGEQKHKVWACAWMLIP